MKRNVSSLYLKIWKIYKKKRLEKNFNKENFNKFLKYLEFKFNKNAEKPRNFYVVKETYLDGFDKPLYILASSMGYNNSLICSAFGNIGQNKKYEQNNEIVHKGFITVDDLEHNIQVIEEHKKWFMKENFNNDLEK